MELYSKERRKARLKFYHSKQWRDCRKVQLKKKPLCAWCLNKRPRVFTEATLVDHENPDWEGWKEFLSGPFNSLCRPCHQLKTGFVDVPKLIKKRKTAIKFIEI